jgi:hypothetical protein
MVARVALRRDANLKLDRWPGPAGGERTFEREIPSDQAEIQTVAVSPDGRFLATSEYFDGSAFRAARTEPTPLPVIRIWDAASGKVVQKLEGFGSTAISLSFSPDGRRLASAFHNDTVLVWDVSRGARPQGARKRLSPAQMERLWKDLGSADAATAYTALTALQESPEEAVAFVGRHVRSVPAAAADRVRQLIRKLESARFAEREASEKELKVAAAQFRTTLKKAAKEPPTLEVRRRLEAVLSAAPAPLPFESLRTLRSIHLLERIGSVEAQRELRTVAEGAAEAQETLAAKEALLRLSLRVDAAR